MVICLKKIPYFIYKIGILCNTTNPDPGSLSICNAQVCMDLLREPGDTQPDLWKVL